VTEETAPVPPGVDTGKASIARVYDYWLGGSHNFLADRDAARVMISMEPNMRALAQANRAFLRRAVQFVTAAGIRQFIDIGSGIPTQGNVHEVAQAVDGQARVVYVDIDPVAVAHSQLILADRPGTGVIQADLRDPALIMGSPRLRSLIDPSQPAALLLAAVLHFVPDGDDPWQIVRSLLGELAPGSFLVISHATSDGRRRELVDAMAKAYQDRVAARWAYRSQPEIERFFAGCELMPPGVVPLPEWRPDEPPAVSGPAMSWVLAGVGRKG
jgi:SAM-dependent methyltransferase